nr:hypothetical protein [uncultured organism]
MLVLQNDIPFRTIEERQLERGLIEYDGLVFDETQLDQVGLHASNMGAATDIAISVSGTSATLQGSTSLPSQAKCLPLDLVSRSASTSINCPAARCGVNSRSDGTPL